ncbi:MAG: ATP-grasp domain-containing protein [Promethearchaeota archaeon]
MKKLKILLTACGCPGAATLIRMLKENGERPVEIIGTDMDTEPIGKYLTDGFYQVPPGHSDTYIPKMLEIIEKEKPDVLFPESSFEVYPLALNKSQFEALGTQVLVSNPESIKMANNKLQMYNAIQKNTDIPLPKFHSARSLSEFHEVIEQLGYPRNPIVFKPQVGKGSRGVRILDSKIDRKRQLMQEKPTSKYMSLPEFDSIFENVEAFPELLVMEWLEGMELTADTLAMDGRELLTTVKTVEQARWGVIVRGELVKRPDLVEQTRKILKAIPLSFCVNLQFIADRIIEINPRVSTFIYQKDLIAPYLAVKLAIGELTEQEVRKHQTRIDYGRRMTRFMDQVFHKGGKRVL